MEEIAGVDLTETGGGQGPWRAVDWWAQITNGGSTLHWRCGFGIKQWWCVATGRTACVMPDYVPGSPNPPR